MTGSSLARRTLGQRLRMLRVKAGVSQSAAARALEVSPQSIGRLEEGEPTRTSSLHINALCDKYEVNDAERKVLLNLATEARQAQKSGGHWWYAYADLAPDGVIYYFTLEETARKFTSFQNTLLPGLLQTADYRRAGEWTMTPGDSAEDVDRRVEMAIERQKRMLRNELEVDVFLSEAVLHHQVGGSAVMGRQRQHLITLGERPNVSIRVIPQSVGSHIGLHVGSFVLLDYGETSTTDLVQTPVVFVESFTGDLYLERESEIGPYRHAVEEIDRVALDRDESRTLIGQIAREYNT
ncbi:helix-turn-helix domain-containing protein [Nocardia alni]|uniref:helix-turn-helix domain-containing protein n=1 Tax=Nocardia alni TaxID=2815723 RepID=UPI001C233B9C|nr:helix-turn-helix transcriptional regulator [Nocardia alni]